MRPTLPTPVRRALGFGLRRPRLLLAPAAAVLLTAIAYAGTSIYIASTMVAERRVPVSHTPRDLGLAYRDVTFPARDDGTDVRGWLIPGVRPDGTLTAERVILVVPGKDSNRADAEIGLLDLSAALARDGFAVLAFDMRGTGDSADAPFTGGLHEQRDVLGAVDFLRAGPLPYPELGRPRAIGGLGISLGGQSLLYAAAREPGIRAVVSDSAIAEVLPIVEARIPNPANLRGVFEPGALLAARLLYGIDYDAIHPTDAAAGLAPRPLFLIHGSDDTASLPVNLDRLASAARQAPGARVQTWLVPGAGHGKAYQTAGSEYLSRVVAFFDAALS